MTSKSRARRVLLLALGLALPAGAGPLLRESSFTLASPGEAIATLVASCSGCSWETRGAEAVVLEIRVDERYSQHVFLTRGETSAEYTFALGTLAAGAHRLQVRHDTERTPKGVKAAIRELRVEPQPPSEMLAHSPVLYARPDTLGRFSDVPLVMWCEAEATPRGTRLRYSVVFSNEDGGTPADRLMATWGRLTDIEFVYGVELAPDGSLLDEQYQGPEHKFMRFAGAREAAHPLMYVVTTNNMVSDAPAAVDGVPAQSRVRFGLVPVPFDLTSTSREAVMDAHPWTYRVSVQEARREGRVDEAAEIGSNRLPDPTRFVTLEACAPAQDAALAFSIGVGPADGPLRWFDSDGGKDNFRIVRRATEFPTGCFRGAVALPAGTRGSDVRGLRFRAYTRPSKDETRPVRPSARLTRVNQLFLLGPDLQPGPSLFSWQGEAPLQPDGAPHEIRIH